MFRESKPSLDHDRVVHLIYEAVDQPEGIRDALAHLVAYVGATKAQMFVTAKGNDVVEHRFTDPSQGRWDDYVLYWRARDPRFAAALLRPGDVLTDTLDIDRAAFEASAIFNDALVQDGSFYAMFGNFPVGDDLLLSQAFIRDERAGAFGAREVERTARLMPHLRRMTRLRHVIQSMRHELADLRRSLDVLPSAVAILEPAGSIVCANAAAEALLRERRGLRTERGKLVAVKASEARGLAAAIAQACVLADSAEKQPASAALASTTPIAITNGDGEPIWVTLFALRPRSPIRERASSRARVLAIFHDPQRRIRLRPATVAKIHGLTATEAQVASALAEGRTLAEYAVAHGCTEQTARTHLKRILDKTGTNRQPDLVRLLLTGAVLHDLR